MIKNLTKKTIISKDYKICNTIFSKALGLMFRKKIIPMVFVFRKEAKVDLHMFFVFDTIDVIFLDKDKKAIEIKENFRPFSFYKARKKARYIIELPKGTVKKTKTDIGDHIRFEKDL